MHLIEYPHRRQNLLTREWLLVSPHRTQRPWQGAHEKPAQEQRPAYDPNCYLCPGNKRSSGEVNPNYTGTFVFTNDFQAILPAPHPTVETGSPLLRAENVTGTCRVICFSPRHDLTLPEMDQNAIRGVVDVWAQHVEELGAQYPWVQLFENKGAIMGCSNPHPHGQVWASSDIPELPAREDHSQREYLADHKSPLLLDYLDLETREAQRLIVENNQWVALTPFWAVWPYEVMLMPRRHVLRLPELTAEERVGLADILKRLLTRYDNLFEISFPYSMGWHGAPTIAGDQSHWQLHAHFYPPLLRSATVKKFMVGYEMLGEPQRDLTAETAAATLRALSEIHFKEASPAN